MPMRRIPWDQAAPGHFEVDLVHHGGPIPTGDFVYTLQLGTQKQLRIPRR
jgi:hypothetical protein